MMLNRVQRIHSFAVAVLMWVGLVVSPPALVAAQAAPSAQDFMRVPMSAGY